MWSGEVVTEEDSDLASVSLMNVMGEHGRGGFWFLSQMAAEIFVPPQVAAAVTGSL